MEDVQQPNVKDKLVTLPATPEKQPLAVPATGTRDIRKQTIGLKFEINRY